MEIRQLYFNDGKALAHLIMVTYSKIDNLEWLPNLPCDELNIKALITNSRYKIFGAFEDNNLLGAISLDFKCEKFINEIFLPSTIEKKNILDIAFAMVHPESRGKGVMKELLNRIIEIAQEENKSGITVRSHIYNFINLHTFKRHGFERVAQYTMQVPKYEFEYLKNQPFISSFTKKLAEKTLENFKHKSNLEFRYHILLKQLNNEQ